MKRMHDKKQLGGGVTEEQFEELVRATPTDCRLVYNQGKPQLQLEHDSNVLSIDTDFGDVLKNAFLGEGINTYSYEDEEPPSNSLELIDIQLEVGHLYRISYVDWNVGDGKQSDCWIYYGDDLGTSVAGILLVMSSVTDSWITASVEIFGNSIVITTTNNEAMYIGGQEIYVSQCF